MDWGANTSWLITSALCTLAFCATYLVAMRTLGSEGAGIWDWLAAELLRGGAQLLWIFSSLGGPGPDGHEGRLFATAIDLATALFQWRSLSQLCHSPVPGRWSTAAWALLLAAGWWSFGSALKSTGGVEHIGLLCSYVSVVLPAAPAMRLARTLWGARVLVFVFCAMLSMAFWSELFSGGSPTARLLELATVTDQAFGILLSAGFLILLLERVREQLIKASLTDQLTEVLNRHGLIPVIQREFHAAKRANRPVSLAILDIDHFKQVNDSFGHGVGDKVLQAFAAHLLEQVRKSDALGRWGGEEFVLLLPDQTLQQAKATAERLRMSIAKQPLSDGLPPVTVSIGIAMAQDADSVDAWISCADAMLYQAKRHRNAVAAE